MWRILTSISAICLSIPAFAMSGNICGLNVASDQGLESANYVYYQVDSFLPEYDQLLSKSYPINDDCWAAVHELLKDTAIVKEYGFSKNGAPPAYVQWYTGWFNGTFNNSDPDAIRSKFKVPFRKNSALGENI